MPRRREEDCESDDDISLEPRTATPIFDRRISPGPSRDRPPTPPYMKSRGSHGVIDLRDATIEQLRCDVEALRKQSQDALNASARVTEELSQARAESARVRASLKSAEIMLEDEVRRRREAERVANEEARARRELEDAMQGMKLRWPRGSPQYGSPT
ncbi:hypothetical protein BV25DRAFT_1820541 [Artomyces pyxidatus]|uniref:Uncharacterized protein n=1 Tax=Artomyces pyxidatus TaxID=48021 RepID=A0ACB8TDR2_9AGAM|nr:hypothetical protein BV25DRAFT_1820541 [Artomyces pyxidatus]